MNRDIYLQSMSASKALMNGLIEQSEIWARWAEKLPEDSALRTKCLAAIDDNIRVVKMIIKHMERMRARWES